MKHILIAGGNSGIGLQAAHEFLALGYKVIIMGRDKEKGKEALLSFGRYAQHASFLPADLSTIDGVRQAAKSILEATDQLDAILHTTGVFMPDGDQRTVDGLNIVFATNYLSRFHLTELLLPLLLKSKKAHVVMIIPKTAMDTEIELREFPGLRPFQDKRFGDQIAACNFHYAAYLNSTYPTIITGVVNAGMAKTDILRNAPWYFRLISKIIGPLLFNSIGISAKNAVYACHNTSVTKPAYWPKPGNTEEQQTIEKATIVTDEVIRFSKVLTASD